jgi:hypothetical protein
MSAKLKTVLTFLLTASVYLNSKGQETPFDSHIRIKNGSNLYLQGHPSGPIDAGDIVFTKLNGEETARIYTSPVTPGEIYFAYSPRIVTSMMINSNGFVGIGTAEPKEKLSVNGNIRAHEIKVETNNWPDYVFDKNYDLPTLSAIKAYINDNRHLPEMPPESIIVKEGLNVGELNKLLVKKVEEVTLYLIQLEEKSAELMSRLAEQEKQNIALQKRIQQLENK